ncbi:MAG: hypothetical protein V5A39_03805 [Haloarculaceae archaeon]
MSDKERADERRRRVLGYVGLAALAGSGAAGAWYVTRPEETTESPERGTPAEVDTPTATPSEPVPELVRRYAPDLYFGRLEKWYPTDPRLYTVERGEETVVDGFTALQRYTERFAETDGPPDPTVFYRRTSATDGVDALQYWMYSVFDQFTVNFHWHDWELLQVFVDSESGEPLLLSASSHSRSVPNNEYLDPSLSGGRRPGVLSEVGSHSSASDINDVIPSFERAATDRWDSDVTNDFLEVVSGVQTPFAYGLPRDEGARLPFVMPELDGQRLDQHHALSLGREDFVDESVTVDSWLSLPRPPADLPLREPGIVMTHPDSSTEAAVDYDLKPLEDVNREVDAFVGPQLSFEFAIPGFVEDRFADHITSVGIPWEQDRHSDPLDDVTDPAHRKRFDGQPPSELSNRVVGRVRQLQSGPDGALGGVSDLARETLTDRIDVSLSPLPVEVATQLASDEPVATVTRSGVFQFLRVSRGEHRLVVDGPGFAPLAERFVHEGGLVRAGGDGDLTVVATEDAAWIRGDGRATTGIERVRIVEEYAGVVYDSRPVEEDRFAVAVHRQGRYTVEIVDDIGRLGTYRVGPADLEADRAVPGRVETGKGTLVRTLVELLEELLELAETYIEQPRERETSEEESQFGVLDRISSALDNARRALEAAQAEDAELANTRLALVVASLAEARDVLSGPEREYSQAAVAVLDPRIRDTRDHAERAREIELP